MRYRAISAWYFKARCFGWKLLTICSARRLEFRCRLRVNSASFTAKTILIGYKREIKHLPAEIAEDSRRGSRDRPSPIPHSRDSIKDYAPSAGVHHGHQEKEVRLQARERQPSTEWGIVFQNCDLGSPHLFHS